MTYCERCKRLEICERVEKGIAHSCVGFLPKKTNADRIRAMSDEELCGFLQSVVQSRSLPIAFIMGSGQNVLVEDWLEWLRQEASE